MGQSGDNNASNAGSEAMVFAAAAILALTVIWTLSNLRTSTPSTDEVSQTIADESDATALANLNPTDEAPSEPVQPPETLTSTQSSAGETEPEATVSPETNMGEDTELALAPQEPQIIAPFVEPEFDLVRVDEEGSAVIAGRAGANAQITVLGNGEPLATTQAGADGNFVVILDIDNSNEPTVLRLQVNKEAQNQQSEPVVSKDSFLVLARSPAATTPPKVVTLSEEGVNITQGLEPAEADAPEEENSSENTISNEAGIAENQNAAAPRVKSSIVTLDTIDYSTQGDVVFSGRGDDADNVRIYVDNQPRELGAVENGRWSVSLPDVDEGIYTVRIDAISPEGKVTSRVESPFKRETPEQGVLTDRVTIQPGFTLWELAEQKYGTGARFVQIFDANRDSIKDPNLIYPGQVFTLPN